MKIDENEAPPPFDHGVVTKENAVEKLNAAFAELSSHRNAILEDAWIALLGNPYAFLTDRVELRVDDRMKGALYSPQHNMLIVDRPITEADPLIGRPMRVVFPVPVPGDGEAERRAWARACVGTVGRGAGIGTGIGR